MSRRKNIHCVRIEGMGIQGLMIHNWKSVEFTCRWCSNRCRDCKAVDITSILIVGDVLMNVVIGERRRQTRPVQAAARNRQEERSSNVPSEGMAGGHGVPGIVGDVATFAHGELLELKGASDALGGTMRGWESGGMKTARAAPEQGRQTLQFLVTQHRHPQLH